MKPSPDIERMIVPVELKLASGDENTLEGYAGVFGHPHESGDVFEPGAFTKTLSERVPKRMVPYLDSHHWDVAHVLGTVTEASEDSRGVHFKAALSSAPSVQDFRVKVKEGHVRVNSIGFVALQERYRRSAEGKLARHLHELKVFEISAVPVADDPNARIVGLKGATSFADLALAPRDRPWDAGAAEKRVRDWADQKDHDGDTPDINWARYRRAFLWVDSSKADELGAYKLPFADIIDGRLMAVPRGIFAAAAVMEGSRGGVDIPDGDKGAVRAHIARYYARMAHEFKDDSIVPPWERKSIDQLILDANAWGNYEYEAMRAAADVLFKTMRPEDRARLMKELSPSAGPTPSGSPTDERGEEGALQRLRLRALKSRAPLG